MYHYGGFYMDLDFEALKSLESIGKGHDIVIGQEVRVHSTVTRRHSFVQPRVHAHLLNGMKRTV